MAALSASSPIFVGPPFAGSRPEPNAPDVSLRGDDFGATIEATPASADTAADRAAHAMKIVQIFGLKNSQSTRAAERFFKERRVPVQFVDLKVKPMAPAEIGRFIGRFGLAALPDTDATKKHGRQCMTDPAFS